MLDENERGKGVRKLALDECPQIGSANAALIHTHTRRIWPVSGIPATVAAPVTWHGFHATHLMHC